MGKFQETRGLKTEAEHILAGLSHHDVDTEQDKIVAQLIRSIQLILAWLIDKESITSCQSLIKGS